MPWTPIPGGWVAADKGHDGVADDLHAPDVGPGDSQHRRDLLPAEASVVHEDAHREDVEERPPRLCPAPALTNPLGPLASQLDEFRTSSNLSAHHSNTL